MELTKQDIKKAIIRSQHCQRNWDLTTQMPDEDLDLLLHAATQCPSKQNSAFYNIFAITDRKIIEEIHSHTKGFHIVDEDRTVTNSQTLANVLFVITDNTKNSPRIKIKLENSYDSDNSIDRDLHTAVGVCAGYLNLSASILGYSTGCCGCYESKEIKNILSTDEDIVLMMGIGYKSDKNRRIHHLDAETVFPTFKKEDIKVTKL